MAEIDQLMSRRVRSVLGKSENDPPDDEAEFGLYHPFWYAYDTWIEHDEHGLYPIMGGYDDQDWMLMQDWKTLDRRYQKAWQEGRAGDPLEAFVTNGRRDWKDL